jgi:CHAT domain-containing protein
MGDPAVVAQQVRDAAGRFQELVLGPVLPVVGDRSLVLVPTGQLHATPWAALPAIAQRAVTVAPSSALWRRGRRGSYPDPCRNPVLVAGPGLPAAAAEVEALRAVYPKSRRLVDADALARAVAGALDGASIAHVAAHAQFRADNPLFSSLELADGPLTVYDLEGLGNPPATVVLSACQVGLSGVRAGDEVMGMVAALLGAGTRTVIAAVLPVPDEATFPFMVALHRALSLGQAPMRALAAAQSGATTNPAGAAFVCFGAG